MRQNVLNFNVQDTSEQISQSPVYITTLALLVILSSIVIIVVKEIQQYKRLVLPRLYSKIFEFKDLNSITSQRFL